MTAMIPLRRRAKRITLRLSAALRCRLTEAKDEAGSALIEAAAALTILPDILHYDRTMPAHYPNGRVMTDDVFSARMTFMTHGQSTPQGIGPHDDLTAEFPFLGMPR